MIEQLNRAPQNQRDSDDIIRLATSERQRLRDDINDQMRIAVAAGIVAGGAFVAAQITGVTSLVIGTVFCGVIVALSIIDIISDMLDISTAERNIKLSQQAAW